MALQYDYRCKKNGLSYLYESTAELPEPQDAYAWRRGVREYADNYHADLVWKNRAGEVVWDGDRESFESKVTEFCEEALTRFMAGDVPSERAESSPEVLRARKQTAELRKAKVSDDELSAALAWIAKQRQKSGQSQAA
jgi:hypothetical protein